MGTNLKGIIGGLYHFVSWFTPAKWERNGSVGHEQQLLVIIVLITVPFALFYAAVSYFIDFHVGVELMLACFVLLLVILAAFKFTGRYRPCANLYLANCFFIAIFGCSAYSGGIHSMVTPWFTLIPVSSMLLLELSMDTVMWTLLTCAVVLTYGVMDMLGFRFPVLYNTQLMDFFDTSCIVGLAIILSWMAFMFGRHREKAMATIVKQKASLQQAMAEIEHLANHDFLTQLPNRRLFMERLDMALAECRRNGRFAAVMFLDLDNFKSLNDSHGHEAGDLLLIQTAERLRRCLREIDTIARIGGDEFAVIVGSLDISLAGSKDRASVIAEKIATIVSEPYVLSLHKTGAVQSTIKHYCTASIGVVLFGNHRYTPDELLGWADGAMYRSKSAGKNSICYYSANDSGNSYEPWESVS